MNFFVEGDRIKHGVSLIQVLVELEANLPVRLLRSEAHLLALIKREPGHSVKFYLYKSELSNRWFYKVLAELLAAGLVSERSNPADQRQKLLF